MTFNADAIEVTHAGGDDMPADEFLLTRDVDDSQRWGEYGSVSEGGSVTVDADRLGPHDRRRLLQAVQ